MEFVPFKEAKKFKQGNGSPNGSIAWEYNTGNPALNIALVKILGRYPEQGRKRNKECTMIVMVIEGSGIVEVENRRVNLTKGDVVKIERDEKYFWYTSRYLLLAPAATPAWTPTQNESVE